MVTLCVHWPARHLTEDRLAALRSVFEAYPGDDPVEIDTGRERVRLPLTVDATARGLSREASEAMEVQGMSHVLDDSLPPL